MSALLLVLLTAADAGLLARPVQVTAEHLELFNAEGRAVYTGHAHAIRDATEVECDTLTAHYDKGQQVQSIDAVGNVFAHQGEKQAWGETGHFDNDTGTLEVLGGANRFALVTGPLGDSIKAGLTSRL